jgi:hypothetical protein
MMAGQAGIDDRESGVVSPGIRINVVQGFDGNVANQKHQNLHYEKITHFFDP